MSHQYSGYGGNPYAEADNLEAGHGTGYGYSYDNAQAAAEPQYQGYNAAHQSADQYELQNYGQSSQAGATTATTTTGTTGNNGLAPLDRATFLSETSTLRSEIQALNSEIDSISTLHDRALTSVDSGLSSAADAAVSEAQQHALLLKEDLARLERDIAVTPQSQAQAKIGQFNSLRSQLKATVQRLVQTEQAYEHQYRENIARQYRVANPEATEEEVGQAAQADWSNEGVFQSAIRHSRQRNATSTYNAVRARHVDLQHIEKTLQELAVLFGQIDQLVASQGAAIAAVDDKAVEVVKNVDEGNVQVDKATEKARHLRKMKWWCFWIVVLIIVVLAIVLGIIFGVVKK